MKNYTEVTKILAGWTSMRRVFKGVGVGTGEIDKKIEACLFLLGRINRGEVIWK